MGNRLVAGADRSGRGLCQDVALLAQLSVLAP